MKRFTLLGAALVAALADGAKPVEMTTAHDPALISRYAGAVLQNAASESFASIRVPEGPAKYGKNSELVFEKSTTVEGKVESYFYIGPPAKTALEVFRNYQRALSDAGFTPLFSCELKACEAAMLHEPFKREAIDPRHWDKASSQGVGNTFGRDIRFVSAKRNDQFVMVFVTGPDSVWDAPAALVILASKAVLETGKVVVSTMTTEALDRNLTEGGKVVLYNLFFDTGKADLKAESAPQLEEMAKYLRGPAKPKVFIVGHTDNVGALEANLALSERRARAVVTALTQNLHVSPSQVIARGVANLAPVASNANDEGRAKNRRVELVPQ